MSARPGVAPASHKPLPMVDLDWQQLAACKGKNPRLFSEPSLAHLGVRICAGCPVRQPCSELTPRESEGVWGGVAHFPAKAILSKVASARDMLALFGRIRRSRGLSQDDVAELIGVTDPFVSMLEAGKRIPRLDTFLQLADAIGVEVIIRKRDAR